MGNGAGKLTVCFTGAILDSQKGRHAISAVLPDSFSDGFGHSFCYLQTDMGILVEPSSSSEESAAAFRLSGASIGANTSTPLSTADPFSSTADCSALFESSTSFAAVPLQITPKLSGSDSGSTERGFLSGPIERGYMSGPVDHTRHLFSSPLDKSSATRLRRSFSHGSSRATRSIIRVIQGAISKKRDNHSVNHAVNETEEKEQWAQGKAGEDRVHVVVSDKQGWIFVGIYDGFNGPDAPDYLSSQLYSFVHDELQALPWENDKIHKQVLEALSRALRRTEEAYLKAADTAMAENPELALMGSCVLAMLMKGDDVYVMNVGDSRALLAQKSLEMINEEPSPVVGDWSAWVPKMAACQLSVDHSTSIKEEVRRIRREHPDDSSAVINGRVKGSLKVTRAFGVGFLKQPKWNDALLEMFRINYVGSTPYISCSPSLRHHRLGPSDAFLILSSDGLFQYMTNEEAVYEVKLFLTVHPEGDPAQHLVEEVLFRAARKAGMEFHDLLEIPLGDRRRYHDDISIIVISLEGRIWRSSS